MLLMKRKLIVFLSIKLVWPWKKTMIALEVTVDREAKSDSNDADENLELKWSVWVYNVIASTSFDLTKEVTIGESSFAELPANSSMVLNFENCNEKICWLWGTAVHSHPVSVYAYSFITKKWKTFKYNYNKMFKKKV